MLKVVVKVNLDIGGHGETFMVGQPLRYLNDCCGCFRLERFPGGAYTRWESAAFARCTPKREI